MKINIFRHFAMATRTLGDSIIPTKYRDNIHFYLRKAGIEKVPYLGFGFAYYIFIALAVAVDIRVMFTQYVSNLPILGMVALSVLLVPLFYYVILRSVIFVYRLYIDVKIQLRIKDMEEKFPEFLSVLAINMRAGNNLDIALESSTGPEFGYLSDEIKLIVRKIKLGGGVEEAINEFKKKYDSDMINDTFDLILLSWKKGGNTAVLVERIYDNIKSSRFLNEKIVASVANYKIFLTLLALGITPAMFALSYHLIDLIGRITSEISNVPSDAALPFTINAVLMNKPDFVLFSILSVVMISICIGIVISIVKSGNPFDGYRQIIFYALGSYVSYEIFMFVFRIFFSLFAI
jgi:hypothetical protein